jgi:hypothetical protein
VCFLVVVVIQSLSTAQVKIEIQGGSLTNADQAPRRMPSPQPSKKLTNQDVIGMVSLDLSDDLIVSKVRMAEATDFDTSVAGLKLLKANSAHTNSNPSHEVAHEATLDDWTGRIG